MTHRTRIKNGQKISRNIGPNSNIRKQSIFTRRVLAKAQKQTEKDKKRLKHWKPHKNPPLPREMRKKAVKEKIAKKKVVEPTKIA